jgi:HD-GYP domain-containing protein (c-di-GMP phosphodiesterase class II)
MDKSSADTRQEPGDDQAMKNPMAGAHITIRMTVVSAFILATVLTAAIAIGLQYYFASRLATNVTERIYTTTSSGIATELRSIGERTRYLLELLAENSSMAENPENAKQLEIFTRLMQENPLFYGLYVGSGDSDFYEVINLESNRNARTALKARPGDRWLTITIDGTAEGEGTRYRQFRYLDENLALLRERREATDYEASNRLWYTRAMRTDTVQRTDPYIFAQLRAPGQTSSKRIKGTDSVIAVDITLENISRFLHELEVARYSEIRLYNRRGEIIASSNGNVAPDGASVQLQAMANNPAEQEVLLEVDHPEQPYYAFTAPLTKQDENGLFVGILASRSSIVGPSLDRVRLSIFITAGLLLLLLPLSWFFASPIVRPVRQLALENEKVRRREFAQVERIPSHITELDALSESMVTMVGAIRDHERAQEELLDSIIRLIAQAIDDKSPYTGDHCERVPELAMMLADRASRCKRPPFDTFCLETTDQWREFRIAAWLHDCGKITTPEHVVDKGSKLETIYNRIHEVRMRFEVLWRDAELDYWKERAQNPGAGEQLAAALAERHRQLRADFAFVATCNVGGEFLDPADQEKLRELGRITWQRHFDNRIGLSPVEELRLNPVDNPLPATEPLLSDRPEHIIERTRATDYPESFGINMDIPEHMYNQGELHNLTVSRGTLTPEDRFKINEHMISTIKMLEGLPFPADLENVPRYASTHHETMKGTGYPRRLKGEELSIPERLLAIADVFEALTAADRPYKKAKTIREAIDILHHMVEDNHLDRDSFELFISEEVYLQYARKYLAPEQIDPVDKSRYLRNNTGGGEAVETREAVMSGR